MNNINTIIEDRPYKIVMSKLRKGVDTKYVKINVLKKDKYYQAECYTTTQVFHQKFSDEELLEFCLDKMTNEYMQLNAWSDSFEYQLLVSKKGAVSFKKKAAAKGTKPVAQEDHNRKKKYLVEEGSDVPPLVDMGIFTQNGKVVADKYDKFKQINRFLEIIDDSLKTYKYKEERPLKIIDFGCGKSYLTFVLYYFLTEIKKYKVNMIGLDLKEDVIRKCNESAKKYGYDSLSFMVGDIGCYKDDVPADMVITLHACDTATDYALYHAISWKAKMIFSVPCCQHELNKQFDAKSLDILARYGIVKERVSALMTDSIRANLLEYCGYKTQVMEFVDFENTPKNLLIRAVRKDGGSGAALMNAKSSKSTKDRYLSEVKELMSTFAFEPTLYKLLEEDGYIE